MWHFPSQSLVTNCFLVFFVPRILATQSENCGFNEFKASTNCYFNGPNIESSWLENRAGNNSIYFVETSCNGDLSYKQACSVEAAARVNTRRKIVVIFAGSVNNVCANSWPISDVLKTYPNVKIIQVNVTEYLQGTPFEYDSKNYITKLNIMMFLPEILPIVTLYKYGGIYVHMDTIVAKSFDELREHYNFVGKEEDDRLGTGVVAFSKSRNATAITTEIMRLLNIMPLNEALSRSIKKNCHAQIDISKSSCKSFTIYDPEYFYPISKEDRVNYFKEFKAISSKVPEKTHAFHVWDAHGTNSSLKTNSVYKFLMMNYCPIIFRSTLQKIREGATEESTFTDKRPPDFDSSIYTTAFSPNTATIDTSIATPHTPSRHLRHKLIGRHKLTTHSSIFEPLNSDAAEEPNTTSTMKAELTTTFYSTTMKPESTLYPNITELLRIGLEKEELIDTQDIPIANEFFTMRRF